MHTAVERFLVLLGWLEKEHRENFHKVLSIGGRQRRYFATSARELNETGTSVHPAQIPGCGYWVVTNNDTPKKARIVKEVLEVLGVPLDQKMRWIRAMNGERSAIAPHDFRQAPANDDEDLRI
jgi:negative modulator of initiation of replication